MVNVLPPVIRLIFNSMKPALIGDQLLFSNKIKRFFLDCTFSMLKFLSPVLFRFDLLKPNEFELLGDNPPRYSLDIVRNKNNRTVPEVLTVFYEVFSWQNYPDHIPSTYIKNMGDTLLIPEMQDRMISNIGNPDVIETSHPHCVELVATEEIAKILNSIAETV